MTKKEAARLITIILDCGKGKEEKYEGQEKIPIEKFFEALDMAIETLGQERCGDCISRQAAIDAIKKIYPVDTEYDCTLYDKIDVMYVLKDLPSIQPKRKTIKVLEQQPCEDVISRQDSITKMKIDEPWSEWGRGWNEAIDFVTQLFGLEPKLHEAAENAENSEVRKGILQAIEIIKGADK